MYQLKDKQCNIISDFVRILKAAEEFYTELYSIQSSNATFIRRSDEEDIEAPSTTSDEIKSALQAITRRKPAGGVGITACLIKHGGDTMREKLAAQYAMPHDFKCTRELKECQHYINR